MSPAYERLGHQALLEDTVTPVCNGWADAPATATMHRARSMSSSGSVTKSVCGSHSAIPLSAGPGMTPEPACAAVP